MSKINKQLEKRYKITGLMNLLLSFGIYMIGGIVQAVYQMNPQQSKITLLVVSALLLVNAVIAIIVAYKLRGKGNTPALAAIIISPFTIGSGVLAASLIGV